MNFIFVNYYFFDHTKGCLTYHEADVAEMDNVIKYRGCSDAQVWTHVFFVPGLVFSFMYLTELFVILAVVFVLSIANHVNYEREGLLSVVEGVAAKTLYLYGIFQLCNSPSVITFFVSFLCCLVTTATFLNNLVFDLYNNFPRKWELYHAVGMHCAPSVWVLVTALNYSPILV